MELMVEEDSLEKNNDETIDSDNIDTSNSLENDVVENMIPERVKNKLIVIFKDKNKKIPSINEINKIAKENNIASSEIEKWFQWIESVYFYRLVKNEILALNKIISDKEDNYDMNTQYMIIKKPIIEK